ncbi:uncharacterized protein TRIVIDRAFT_227405 [Trichoderma virens Gv29-8]|uniref:Zn(2)-C6 fungal-type domain-containing protein n=1 Tax=Hypocrea virens (strain Gv29-8 / FGSC 10586) TaxID=413071 RepID=G9N9C7_HYPVG|nr:uncharacterized protein TRIVIDRAFT_227405 [Trichoderma virens Gv29-8]EHK16548.1 hypothetical protein TRIVIDRAFT_227405 [Trichoderma virens Gv29-8]UKZ52074.1 hypothetical protein TrVGV298_005843 [Trichoderma virens]
MTLHRPGDYVEPSSGTTSSPCISGRTLIACQNCANAKTGCDKKIPCSRCMEKNLQCTARYARRASKAAIRAAQAAPSLAKSQIAGFSFGSRPFRKNSLSFEVDKCPENIAQDSPHHLRDDSLWDILNPLSPLSGYSAAASSLGGSSSYSDKLNVFENKQNSPIPIFSEFSTDIDLINNDVSIRIPSSYRCYPANLLNDSNNSHFCSKISYLPELEDYSGLIQAPDACEDASGFLAASRKSELDIGSTSNQLQSKEIPSLSSARTLVYSWVKMDQELSLFYDTEHVISAYDLERPLPDPELPWDTKNILQTSDLYLSDGLYTEVKTEGTLDFEARPTLNQLFKDFLHGTLSRRVPPRHLELLLHPLQALVHHSQSLLSWAKHSYSPALSDAANSTLLETQRLLRMWHNLAMEACNENLYSQDTPPALVLYHFTCLNLVASFIDIERLADRESLSISFWQQSLQNERGIRNRQDAILHCGQALRYLRAVNVDTHPWWWPTAVHRAILTLWAASTLGSGPSHAKPAAFVPKDSWPRDSMDVEPGMGMSTTPELSIIAIDNITPEDPVLSDANWSERYLLVLTRQDEGVVVLNDAMGILEYGISLIKGFPSSVEGEAAVTKLRDLGQAWEGNNGSQMYYQD